MDPAVKALSSWTAEQQGQPNLWRMEHTFSFGHLFPLIFGLLDPVDPQILRFISLPAQDFQRVREITDIFSF